MKGSSHVVPRALRLAHPADPARRGHERNHLPDPGSLPLPGQNVRPAVLESVEGLRVTYLPALGGFPVEAEVRAAVDVAAEHFTALEVHVESRSSTCRLPIRMWRPLGCARSCRL